MSIKIALLGFGTAASGISFFLKESQLRITKAAHSTIKITKVLVRGDNEKNRLLAAGNDCDFITSVDDILNNDSTDIVVELMRRIEPARTFITKVFETGKNVVSANKNLIITHGEESIELAKNKGVAFYYEAAVTDDIPVLRTFANSLTSDKVTRILGVFNGTSSFMMTRMVDEGWTYEGALKTIQEFGYTESDPTDDIKGISAAYKAVILDQFGFGMTIDFDGVAHKGITTITPDDIAVAQELDYAIKLVGNAHEIESGTSAEVSPTLLPKAHPLTSVSDVINTVFVESIGIGGSVHYGPGAGQEPATTPVIADIIRIYRRIKDSSVGRPFNEFVRETTLTNPADVKGHYYFAINTPDKKGQLLRLTEIFNSENTSSEQVLQQKVSSTHARVVIITYLVSKTQLADVTAKLEAIEDFQVVNTLKVLGE